MLTSLKSKLVSAFAVLTLAILGVAYFGLHTTTRTDEMLEVVTKDIAPSVDNLQQVHSRFLQLLWMNNKAIVATDAHDAEARRAARALYDESWRELDAAVARWDAEPMVPEEEPAWREMKARLNAYRPDSARIWNAIEAGDVPAARKAIAGVAADRDAFLSAADALVQVERTRMAKVEREAHEYRQSAGRIIFIVTLVAIAAAIAIGTITTRAITKPVAELKQVAQRLAEGDLDQEIHHRGADEVGALADSFRKTTQVLRSAINDVDELIGAAQSGDLERRADALRYRGGFQRLVSGMNRVMEAVSSPIDEANQVLGRLAARDLTARADGQFAGAYQNMMTSLNTAADNLRQSLLQVAMASEQVAAASAEIASSSESVAHGASEQASALEESTTALANMADATKRTAENAQTANGLAQEASQRSTEGTEAMAEMHRAMGQVRGAAEGTAAIIRDINEIAFQINLLALNAAVEAARAGEAGRGFAVVAEEVRSLALRSKEAASKTEALINDSMQVSKRGEELSGRVNDTLGGIVGSVSRVGEIIALISTASQEQARGISETQRAMAQMDKTTQMAAASAEETSASADQLASQSRELASLVGKFELGTVTQFAERRAPPKLARQLRAG